MPTFTITDGIYGSSILYVNRFSWVFTLSLVLFFYLYVFYVCGEDILARTHHVGLGMCNLVLGISLMLSGYFYMLVFSCWGGLGAY